MLLGDDSDVLRVGEVTAARLNLAAHLPKDMHHFHILASSSALAYLISC